MSLFFYLFTFVINLWHRKFITADVTAVFQLFVCLPGIQAVKHAHTSRPVSWTARTSTDSCLATNVIMDK